MQYNDFSDLPKEIQRRIIAQSPKDYGAWVKQPVPALGGKSVLETMNDNDGYRKLVNFLGKIEGYFG